MDERPTAPGVEWREWGPACFETATQEDKPLLLSLVTSWSPECREMDETTYAEPRVVAHVNDRFVPVRVDADERPRVRERYNMGGFPSTVFLTPEGRILTGATFLGVDGFRQILERVLHTWDAQGEGAGSLPRALRDDQPPAGQVDEEIERHMVSQLVGTYDEEFGGWGQEVKFPLPRTVEFALVRARDQATRTLEAIQTHLLDTYDGGFYRYAHNRDWSDIRREKLTDENAALVRAFAYGYRYTGNESYRQTAERTVEYLTTTLWTGEAFAASQRGDQEYFKLEPTDREDADPPPVDGTVFADRNGLAVDALLRLAAYTDDETATRYARRARDHVHSTLVEDGRVTHCEGGESGLLLDQARLLTGLTTSWEVLAEPGPAQSVADWTVETLQTDGGAFRDGPASGAGLLSEPLYPLDTAIECAEALSDLALLTGEVSYRERAREALAAFAGATERMGVDVAHYGATAARIQHPQAIEVGTPAGSDLHRAALRLADHETVVVPAAHEETVPGTDVTRTPLADGCVEAGVARVVEAGDEQGRAASPPELESILTSP